MKNQLFVCVLLASLLAIVRTDDEQGNWDPEEEECVGELKLNKTEIQGLKKSEFFPENNTDFNNYLACYWKKRGGMEEDGDFVYDTIHTEFLADFRKIFGKDQSTNAIIIGGAIRTAISECSEDEAIQGESHGETIAKFQNCVLRKLYKVGEEMNEER